MKMSKVSRDNSKLPSCLQVVWHLLEFQMLIECWNVKTSIETVTNAVVQAKLNWQDECQGVVKFSNTDRNWEPAHSERTTKTQSE